MRAGLRKPAGAVDEENPYWISFSDIMAGLLILFMLASLAFILQLTRTKQDVDEAIKEIELAESVRAAILQEIQNDLQNKGITVEIVDNQSVLRIPDRFLFASGSCKLPKDSEKNVNMIGKTVLTAIDKEDRLKYIDTVFIEGHTDSDQYPNHPMGNWELSTCRATTVWSRWLDAKTIGDRLRDLKNMRGDPLFSVSGYADTRRVEPNDETEQQKQRNRRIDLRFTVRRPTIGELKEIDRLIEGN